MRSAQICNRNNFGVHPKVDFLGSGPLCDKHVRNMFGKYMQNGPNGVLVGAHVDIRVWLSPGGPGGGPGGPLGGPRGVLGGSWGVLEGFVGGFWMILSSLLVFTEHDEDAYARLVTFTLWVIGFITIMIEGRPLHMQSKLVYDIICLFVSFLKYVWGRGFLYFVAGIFQFYQKSLYKKSSWTIFIFCLFQT